MRTTARLFPKMVTCPAGTVTPALVVVQPDEAGQPWAYVFAAQADWPGGTSAGRRVMLVGAYRVDGVPPEGPPPANQQILSYGGGPVVTLAAAGGCGCSHPLKRWRPTPKFLDDTRKATF